MDAEQTVSCRCVPRRRADEKRLRTRLGPSAVIPPERAFSAPGMALFEVILVGRSPSPPFADPLDFAPIQVEPGAAVFQGRPQRRHGNPPGSGTVHGGRFATLLDSAAGRTLLSTLPIGKGYPTPGIKVNTVHAPLVRAEGRAVHIGRQVATAQGRLISSDGALDAHATTTGLIFDHAGAGDGRHAAPAARTP